MRPLLLSAVIAVACIAPCAAQEVMPVLPPPDMASAAVATADSAAVTPPATNSAGLLAALDPVLAGDWRSAGNQARDVYRHPRETLAFFGVRPDQDVIEIWPSGGWYAEVLAPLLRDSGHYTGIIVDPTREPDADAIRYAERSNRKLRELLAAHPAVFDKAVLVETPSAMPVLGPAGSADVVLTFRNVHNWVMDGNEKAMFKAFFDVLRPGGTLGVVDHRAKPDQPAAEMKTSGYLPEAYVIGLAQAAGFELVGKSEINANPRDTKDYPNGVWTLPPSLSQKDVDRAKFVAIGESDRMTLRFVKPAR